MSKRKRKLLIVAIVLIVLFFSPVYLLVGHFNTQVSVDNHDDISKTYAYKDIRYDLGVDSNVTEDSLPDSIVIVTNSQSTIHLGLYSHIHKELHLKFINKSKEQKVIIKVDGNDWGIGSISQRKQRTFNILSKNLIDVTQKMYDE